MCRIGQNKGKGNQTVKGKIKNNVQITAQVCYAVVGYVGAGNSAIKTVANSRYAQQQQAP